MPQLQSNSTRKIGRAIFLVLLSYLALSICGAWWVAGYGDLVRVPNSAFLVFGASVNLVYGDGPIIYLFASAIVVPLLLLAVISGRYIRWISFLSAVVVWVGIGHWMYAG